MTVQEAIASQYSGIYGHSFKSRRKQLSKYNIPLFYAKADDQYRLKQLGPNEFLRIRE